ncbi:hypothetical protein HpMS107_26330 [Helicobacter pylori]
MALRAEFGRHAFGRFKLGRMALAIAHGQRIGFEAGRVGHGEDGGGIKAAGKQNDGAFGHDDCARNKRAVIRPDWAKRVF